MELQKAFIFIGSGYRFTLITFLLLPVFLLGFVISFHIFAAELSIYRLAGKTIVVGCSSTQRSFSKKRCKFA